MNRQTLLLIAAFLFTTSPGIGIAQTPPKTGAVGDSLLDEYFDQVEFGVSLGYAKNAFEILDETGRIDAGPKNPGGWGGTRGTGYEYNWALAGSTTDDVINDNQPQNLAAQAASGVTRAVMIVGSNDLFPAAPPANDTSSAVPGIGFVSPGSSYEAIYFGVAPANVITDIAAAAVQNVVDAARIITDNAINDPSIKLVVATAPEYGITPFAQSFYPDPIGRERVDDVMEAWNAEATNRLTTELGVPVVDLYSFTKDIWGDNGSPNPDGDFKVGGVEIAKMGTGGVDFADVLTAAATDPPGVFDTPSGDNEDAFVHDGIHPNTVVNGVFASLFLQAFNQEFGDSFELLTAEDILTVAGNDMAMRYQMGTGVELPGGATYSDYIVSAVPEPTTMWLVGVMTLGACVRARKRMRRC